MPLSVTGRAVMLEGLALVARYAAMHKDDPGEEGDYELTGPECQRQAMNWHDRGDSAKAARGLSFTIPAGHTITHVGFWTEAKGGQFLGSRNLAVPESFPDGGTYVITELVESLSSED